MLAGVPTTNLLARNREFLEGSEASDALKGGGVEVGMEPLQMQDPQRRHAAQDSKGPPTAQDVVASQHPQLYMYAGLGDDAIPQYLQNSMEILVWGIRNEATHQRD